jgi:rare lipoprotein A
MRHLLPVAAIVATLSVGLAPAAANSPPPAHKHHRGGSDVSLGIARHSVLSGGSVVLRGKVFPRGRHLVKIVYRGAAEGVITTASSANGVFSARFAPPRPGAYAVRAFRGHDRHTSGSTSHGRRLTAYRQAGASYYGPGLYGNGVACGGTLTPSTLGVANKTLPCGTMVKLRYHGHSITVPVIDRGPYVAGRDYDLTEATRDKLGFPGVDTLLADH